MKNFKLTLFTFIQILLLLLLCARPTALSNAFDVRFALADTVTAQPTAGSYACILSDTTYFYSAPDLRRGVFVLPKTYYVKLLSYDSDFCKIEYLYDDNDCRKLIGYAQTDKLTFVDYIPNRPYLYYLFDVQYYIDDTAPSDSSFLNQLTVTCVYYGDYKIGSETYCYVLRGESFGYIPKPSTLLYEENTEYADRFLSTPPDTPTQSTPLEEENSSPAQIAILITLCLLVPILAALILKPPHRPPYETNE
jgi:hypothetical protein